MAQVPGVASSLTLHHGVPVLLLQLSWVESVNVDTPVPAHLPALRLRLLHDLSGRRPAASRAPTART